MATLVVDLSAQTLSLNLHDRCVRTFEVSTAALGAGQENGSHQTPLGKHIVRAAIGANEPEGAVFAGRRPTGERWTPELHARFPGRDWILSRILWLSGTERGFNRLGTVDTMRRYIYIHGTPDSEPLGTPASHGCIRMNNADIIWLFDRVKPGTPVFINAGAGPLDRKISDAHHHSASEQEASNTASLDAHATDVEDPNLMSTNISMETSVPLPERLSLGPIMVDVDGLELDATDRDVLAHPMTGGVILFARNYQDQRQLKQLVEDIRTVNPELIVAVDQEGGRVQRFREGFTTFPPMREFGALYENSPDLAVQRAEDCGWVLGQELAAMDIDLTFAPVVDVDYGVSDVIGDRAFASDPAAIVALAGAFMGGLHSAGLASCIKHFPGHGFVTADSHHELPKDLRSRDEFESDLLPFRQLASRAQSVMTAHLLAPCVEDKPVSFSSRWVTDLLRNEMGFRGVVFSDDLSMKGADCAGGVRAKVEQALAAGCQFLPICNDRDAVLELYQHPVTAPRSRALVSLRRHLVPPVRLEESNRYKQFQRFLSPRESL